MFARRWAPLLVLGAVTVWLWAPSRKRPCKKAPPENFLRILDKFCELFHEIFTELWQTRSKVARQMESQGLQGVFGNAELMELLMQQKFSGKLQKAEMEALDGTDPIEFRRISDEYATHPEVQIRTRGLQNMKADAAEGKPPLLPGVTLTAPLSDSKFVIDLLRKVKAEQLNSWMALLRDTTREEQLNATSSTGPTGVLSSKLDIAAAAAQASALLEAGISDVGLFVHALAVHTRADPAFGAQRELLEEAHRVKVISGIKQTCEKPDPVESARLLSEANNSRLVISVGGEELSGAVHVAKPKDVQIPSCPVLTEPDLPCFILLKAGRFVRLVKTTEEAKAFLKEDP